MNRITYLVTIAISFMILFSCGGEKKSESSAELAPPGKVEAPVVPEKAESPDENAEFLKNKGLGPVTNVEFAEIVDETLAKEGEKIYNMYCIACHKIDEDYLGPAPKGILKRRSPEWVMNIILNTEEMNQKDPIAKELIKNSNGAIMVSMGLKEEQARAILEFFRTI